MENNDVVPHPVTFGGSASEYFRIWIVNLLLSVCTLGIYSAWAKVRSRRYFLGNTILAGSGFDYHGDPIKILKGRLIMAGLLVLYGFAGRISPIGGGIAAVLFLAIFPWLLVRAAMFNLGNTSYRGLRFGFQKDYKGSYAVFFKGIAITIVTLGLGFAYARFMDMRFRISRSRFGKTPFVFSGTATEVFGIYAKASGIVALALILCGILIGIGGTLGSSNSEFDLRSVGAMVGMLTIYPSGLIAMAMFNSRLFNYKTKSTTLGPIRFQSTLRMRDLSGLYITNLLAIAFTLGLALPWVLVRMHRYRVSRTTVLATPADFDAFASGSTENSGAVADAAADFWDIDLGL